MSEFDKERFDRYIEASKALHTIRDNTADATEGYWGEWVVFHDAVDLLLEAMHGGVLKDLVAINRPVVASLITQRKRIPRRGPQRAARIGPRLTK